MNYKHNKSQNTINIFITFFVLSKSNSLIKCIMSFDYSQINLVPQKCIVGSRSECDTSVTLGNHIFRLPVVPANMECVIDFELAERLASAGYFYILHRFYTDNQIIEFCKSMRSAGLIVSISIGVNESSRVLLQSLKTASIIPDFLTIDIAHGHAIKMESMIGYIYDFYSEDTMIPFIIAGNVSTHAAARDLEAWGANAIKVGIGPGSACSTYPATGFGSRGIQASVICECTLAVSIPIIADGGIKTAGDIAKSIVLGALFCMVGGMFSSLRDSPGNIVIGSDGRQYKEFWGSASEHQSGKKERIEGFKTLNLMVDKTVLEEMKYLEECLQSAISYGGGMKLAELRNVDWIQHSAI
jgi:GMP reductase